MLDRMIDEVIRKFGFEAKETISFCRLCERAMNKDTKANRFKVVEKYYSLMG